MFLFPLLPFLIFSSHSIFFFKKKYAKPREACPAPSQLHDTLLKLQGHNGPVVAADWVHGGEWLVSGSYDRSVRLWDANQGTTVLTLLAHDAEVTNVVIDPSQKLIVSSARDTTARLWDFRQPGVHEVKIISGHTDSVSSAVICGNTIVTASDDRFVKVWKASARVRIYICV